MSAENANDEYRRVPRRKIAETIQVVDTMTDAVIGRLGNLSETGMLVITNVPLVDDAPFLPAHGSGRGARAVECCAPAGARGSVGLGLLSLHLSKLDSS